MRVATRETTESGSASGTGSRSGCLRGLPGFPGTGDQRSALMPLIQSVQSRRVSCSWWRARRLPLRDGAARTRAGRVTRSVQDRTSLCAATSARHVDQASRAPAGTKVRTRLPLVTRSECWEHLQPRAGRGRSVSSLRRHGMET